MIKHTVMGAAVGAALAMGAQHAVHAQMSRDHGAKGQGIAVEVPWARATPGRSANGAAYFTVTNRGPSGDRLIGASSSAAGRVELHTHIHDKGVMRMRKLDGVVLAPGVSVTFRPGGHHVMLVGLKAPLRKGGTFPLTLRFEKSAPVTVTVKVMGIGAMGGGGSHGHRPGGPK
ncbi:MAG: copper chaperone PCu(A)C [Alphaproteobacteria bacterium]|nr:copper chaperone PCu(A)C [Alphaproteobacteria bacterium]